jgi:hypothetical protein
VLSNDQSYAQDAILPCRSDRKLLHSFQVVSTSLLVTDIEERLRREVALRLISIRSSNPKHSEYSPAILLPTVLRVYMASY